MNDFLAGLAGGLGGLSQGLQTVNNDREKQARLLMAQRQQKMQEDEIKRQRVIEAVNFLNGGSQVNKNMLDEVSAVAPELLSKFEKHDDGQAYIRKTPAEIRMDMILKNEQEKDAFEDQQKQAYNEWTRYGESIYDKPDAFRLSLQAKMGPYGANIKTRTPEQELENNVRLKGIETKGQLDIIRAQVAAQAQAQAAQARISAQAKMTRADAIKMALGEKDVLGQPVHKTRESLEARVQELMQIDGGQAPTGNSALPLWTERIVKGVPAYWDGTGWVAK